MIKLPNFKLADRSRAHLKYLVRNSTREIKERKMSFSESMRELEECEINEVSGGGYIAEVLGAGAAICALGAAVLAAPILGGAMLGAAAVYGTASAVMAVGGAVAELNGY